MGSPTFKILFTSVIALLWVTNFCQSYLCLNYPKCYCTTSKTGITEISCHDVADVQPINDVLKNFTQVYSLRIYGQHLGSLPSKCFENQSIEILEISSTSLRQIADDALTSIKGLEIGNFNGSMFSTIPKGITSHEFRILQMTNGALQGIDNQLQTIFTTTDILLKNNKITYIVENAFENTVILTNLDLSYNLLKTLNVSTFRYPLNLKKINLAHNQLLTLDGVFHDLNLETLNLYGNNLSSVDNAFNDEGLFFLKWLDIGGNLNLNISGSTFSHSQKKLTTFRLNDNKFERLDPNLIENLNSLTNLYLAGNNLSSIPQDFFASTKYIRNIVLSNNNIKTMKNLISFSKTFKLDYLKYIALDGNEISSVDISSIYQHVLHLNLGGNQITLIKMGDFTNLTSVNLLNLSCNPLTNIENGSFPQQQKLKSLDLSFTKIKTLGQSLEILSDLSSLRISHSSLQVVEFKGLKNLKYVYLDGNNIASIANAFSDCSNLSYLNLAGNNLTTMVNGTLPAVHFKSHSWQKLWLANNPLSCDCRLLWMLDWLKNNHSKLEDKPLCHAPVTLRNVAIRDLNETVLKNWKEDCPEGCECRCIVADVDVATICDCSNRHLTNNPNTFPKNAKNIDVSGNKITFIEFNANHYPQLEVLNLESNELLSIHLELSSYMKSLYLSRNNLTRISYESWNDTNLNQITLSMNPWICDCNTWNFRQWLITHNSSIKDLEEVKCGDNGRWNNRVIVTLTHDNLCPGGITEKDKTVIILAVLSVLLLLICCIIYLSRKLLMAMLFASGCRCLKAEEEYNYSFDAFLLFADEDDEFALGTIEEGLEADSYRLFVPSRQVLLSSSPLSINSSVADCCKVIVLLTSNFLRNSQCMQLLKTAMACSLEKTAQTFIFITTDGLPPELEFDPILNCLVKRSTCIKWGDCFFWTKLKYNLPKKCSKMATSNDEEAERLI